MVQVVIVWAQIVERKRCCSSTELCPTVLKVQRTLFCVQ
jgi:hypothetical protein